MRVYHIQRVVDLRLYTGTGSDGQTSLVLSKILQRGYEEFRSSITLRIRFWGLGMILPYMSWERTLLASSFKYRISSPPEALGLLQISFVFICKLSCTTMRIYLKSCYFWTGCNLQGRLRTSIFRGDKKLRSRR